MTLDDIIRMAREQGLPETEVEGVFRVNSDDLGRMLAAEREACADICDQHASAEGIAQRCAAAIRARRKEQGMKLTHEAAQAVAAEREACAKVCEQLEPRHRMDGEWLAGWSDGTDDCAAAIRARGQKENPPV